MAFSSGNTIVSHATSLWANSIVSSGSYARFARLIGMVTLAACFMSYLLFTTPDYLALGITPNIHNPLLRSYPYVEIRYPEEGSPEDGILWPYRAFKSSPFKPPSFNITGNGGKLADGYLFMTPKSRDGNGTAQNFPVIIRQDNELVYCMEQAPNGNNFRVQNINGTPHLTVWKGKSIKGHGYGDILILDSAYDETLVSLDASINIIDPKFPGSIDFHDQRVMDGTIFVAVYNATPHDLSAVGGSENGWLADSMVYGIDIESGEVVFTWSALEHLQLTDTRLPMGTTMGSGHLPLWAFDFFHINSIQPFGKDALLISSRHFWACFLISLKTGEVLWEFNGSGEGGNFGKLPPEAQFRWQHDAQVYEITDTGFTLTLFDNHNMDEDINVTSTRGLAFKVQLPPDSSTPPVLLRDLEPRGNLFVQNQGSYQIGLSNGNQLMGFGPVPVVREFGPSGSNDLRWEGRFGYNNMAQSYRVLKSQWQATPKGWGPSLVLERNNTSLTGYVSWNGATDVDTWNIYNTENAESLDLIGKAVAYGFETVIEIPDKLNDTQCIMAAAVQEGTVAALSNIVCVNDK